jgi:hypothetical protein
MTAFGRLRPLGRTERAARLRRSKWFCPDLADHFVKTVGSPTVITKPIARNDTVPDLIIDIIHIRDRVIGQAPANVTSEITTSPKVAFVQWRITW